MQSFFAHCFVFIQAHIRDLKKIVWETEEYVFEKNDYFLLFVFLICFFHL